MPPSEGTVVRVRGKRTATAREKWKFGRRRPGYLQESYATASESSSRTSSVISHKRRRRQRELSALEKLPVEIIQQIFFLSDNIAFPASSPTLLQQLSNTHLYHLFLSRTLGTLRAKAQAYATASPTPKELEGAVRILDSRFCTWTLFRQWLESEHKAQKRTRLASCDWYKEPGTKWPEIQLWSNLGGFLMRDLPAKLLGAPWTDDKTSFLRTLVLSRESTGRPLDPPTADNSELIKAGLSAAVSHNEQTVATLLLSTGVDADAELLRTAVIDGGCDVKLISRLALLLVSRQQQGEQSPFLDPAIWSWAERAKLDGDERGEWLIRLLKNARQFLERNDHNAVFTVDDL